MIKLLVICSLVSIFAGCTPKVGKEIFIEPQGNLRWESSQTDAVLGVLSLLGISAKNGEIALGTDVAFINRWHSDIVIRSLTYTLTDTKTIVAAGEIKGPYRIASGGEQTIPVVFRIETNHLNDKRILSLIRSQHKLFIRGEALIEVWGIEKRYPFEKEVGKALQKRLTGV